jgi:NAD(P)-dependent dehydrogenase (short-subunit alcohol dehydrogenase family)
MAAVLVTGASSGIGWATAEALAHRGWEVYAGTRSTAPPGTTPIELDVTRPVEHLRALDLHALVNNAGIAVIGPLEYLPLEELRRQLEVNTIGQLAVIQACLPSLRANRGRIVNVSSISGRVALPLFGPYAASKFAFEALTDSLRREQREVKVSLIEPGSIATPIWSRTLEEADALWNAMPHEAHERHGELVKTLTGIAQRAPHEGTPPEQVVDAILHALSARRPRTRYVVGRQARIQAVLARAVPTPIFDRLIRRLLNDR